MSRNSSIVDLQQTMFDAVTVSYPDAVTEIYTFRKPGLTGNISLEVTVVYTSATKEFVASILRTPGRVE